MIERLNVFRRGLVILRRLAREAVEQVPRRFDAVLPAEFQQLDVLQRRHALAHQFQHVAVQALDAWLNRVDAGLLQQRHLLRLQIRLHLVEQVHPELPLHQHRQQGPEVVVGDDVVDRLEPLHVVACALPRQFVDDAGRALGAERHGLAVQPAERAV